MRRAVTLLLLGLVLAGCSSDPASSSTSPAPATPSASATATAPAAVTAIQRLTAKVGYIAVDNGAGVRLEKTNDGGATWQALTVPVPSLFALRFIDEQVGWAIGMDDRAGVLLRTGDGGGSWQSVLTIPTRGGQDPVQQVQAVNGQRAWALTLADPACQATCQSDLQLTTDGGHSWTTELQAPIVMMRFASATRGWIAVGDPSTGQSTEVRTTSDGGRTWTTGLRTVDGSPLGLDAASVTTAWTLTRNGGYCTSSNCSQYSLYRTDNGGANWALLNNPKYYAQGCSGGHLIGPLFASPTVGWFGLSLGAGGANVGSGGLMSTTDGGQTWRCSTTPADIDLITAADPLHVWVSGRANLRGGDQSSTLYATEDGGSTWKLLPLPRP